MSEEMQFKIEWCDLCQSTMIICPKCGNNCCNGLYGKIDKHGKPTIIWDLDSEGSIDCDICPLAYQYQSLMWKSEKFCTCEKECKCEYKRGDFFRELVKVNPDCHFHREDPQPNPDCPIHGSKKWKI
jgi:hypothetical protein